MKIRTIGNHGIHLFRDGMMFSIQFGPSNYCSNYNCEMSIWRENDGHCFTSEAFPDYFIDSCIGHVPIKVALQIALNFKPS